jgi:hypothetical protein
MSAFGGIAEGDVGVKRKKDGGQENSQRLSISVVQVSLTPGQDSQVRTVTQT